MQLLITSQKLLHRIRGNTPHYLRNQTRTLSLNGGIFEQIKSLPGGFKAFFLDAKEAFKVRNKPEKSRREVELIRTASESFVKVSLLGLLYLIPIVGNIPVIIALGYPRHLLTRHFWSAEQHKEFMLLDYQETKEARAQLLRLITNSENRHILPSEFHKFKNGETLSLEMLSPLHVVTLAQATGLIGNAKMQRILANFPSLVSHLLRKRSQEIAHDDILLLADGHGLVDKAHVTAEGGRVGLSLMELREACLRRGADPSQNEAAMKHFLGQWLRSAVVTQTIHDLDNSNSDDNRKNSGHVRIGNKLPASLLLHASALPARFIDGVDNDA